MVTRTLLATSATLLTVGATAMLPAEAGTLTLGVSGSGSANIGINSLLAGQTFGDYTTRTGGTTRSFGNRHASG
ncbi:hypothetical protein XM38_030820 [Halomicronema hongdechloris C2206]|uniref:Uncharacterized protein n=1 Tax=Halomicronema hongdechloris C2206 TaxID=1641165 RepID=A0A1Z3HPA7_9CYAN|nr:hypothetical protein [Halomicronema hongdechloris]ASC72128.1 hypothetical protein XM38_030820 [Halomicronema hongdechloris C2206]